MKKFRFLTIMALLLVSIFTLSACTLPWEENGCAGTSEEESIGPMTQLSYSVLKTGTSYSPTLQGTAKFKFCPEKMTLSCNGEETEVKPYTTVYAPVEYNGKTEYYYILSFNNVIYYDSLRASEYAATLNAYKDGEIEDKVDMILNVPINLHYFQNFNSTTGEMKVGMNEDKADLCVYDNYNDNQTQKQYFEKVGMTSDGLGQRTFGLVPIARFGTTVDQLGEGALTYLMTAEEGYVINSVKLKSYVTFCHAGISEDWEKADIKIQISYDNVNFEDVYSLRADDTISDTWIDGNTYYGVKPVGCLNGAGYVLGTLPGMTDIPVDALAGTDCRYYINCDIPVASNVQNVYVRILCINVAKNGINLSHVPTRIHNVKISASQI